MPRVHSFDEKCLDLARAFARDWNVSQIPIAKREPMLRELAQRIQSAIEDYEQEVGIDR